MKKKNKKIPATQTCVDINRFVCYMNVILKTKSQN